jgi:hypothetical protein
VVIIDRDSSRAGSRSYALCKPCVVLDYTRNDIAAAGSPGFFNGIYPRPGFTFHSSILRLHKPFPRNYSNGTFTPDPDNDKGNIPRRPSTCAYHPNMICITEPSGNLGLRCLRRAHRPRYPILPSAFTFALRPAKTSQHGLGR